MKKTWKLKGAAVMAMLLCAMTGMTGWSAQNYVHDNGSVAYLNTGAAISSGELVDLGNRYGVAVADIASNATGTVRTDGIWKFKRATTNAITAGTDVYYSDADTVTESSTADTYVGQCATSVDVVTELTNSAGDVVEFLEVDLNAPQRAVVVGLDVLAPDGDGTSLTGVALDTEVWGAADVTIGDIAGGQLITTNTIAMQDIGGNAKSDYALIRVWISESEYGAASTNNIEALTLSTGTAVATETANADYWYVTSSAGAAVATITATAAGTNYLNVSVGANVTSEAIVLTSE